MAEKAEVKAKTIEKPKKKSSFGAIIKLMIIIAAIYIAYVYFTTGSLPW